MRSDLVTLDERDDCLRIYLTAFGRAYITEAAGWSDDPAFMDREDRMWELLEGHRMDAWVDFVRPEDIGALTGCPFILTTDPKYPDHGPAVLPYDDDSPVYWFEAYAVRSPVQDMLDDGYVDLPRAREADHA